MNQQPSLTERVQQIEGDRITGERTQLPYVLQILELLGKTQPARQEPVTSPTYRYFYRTGYSLRNALYVLSQMKL